MVVIQKGKNQDGSIRYLLSLRKHYVIRKKWKKGMKLDLIKKNNGNLLLKTGSLISIQVTSTGQHFINLPKDLVESNGWRVGDKVGFSFDEDLEVELSLESNLRK